MNKYKLLLTAGSLLALCIHASAQNTGSNATGLLALSGTVNLMQLAKADAGGGTAQLGARRLGLKQLGALSQGRASSEGFRHHMPNRIKAPLGSLFSPKLLGPMLGAQMLGAQSLLATTPSGLSVVSGGGFDFNGMTQLDQQNANGGDMVDTLEPPNPSIAVANGYVLEGVNNAVQIYGANGHAVLPAVLASNEVFGLAPAYDANSGLYGPFPTDMRVFYDSDIERWFILQRAQDEDIYGDLLATSHLYMAVSQGIDPTGNYNVYTADTTDLSNVNCPCTDDYPQIGADRYGFYISANQYNSDYESFADASILALSKQDLKNGAASPTAVRFVLQFQTGYEFAIQPASTPPSAVPFLANGGVEYLSSTAGQVESGDTVAIWTLSNTISLNSSNPNLTLAQITVPTLSYQTPPVATQPSGPLEYNSAVPTLDGGDTRVLSLTYSGARLYLTFGTGVLDQNSNFVAGGALVVLSPTIRGGVVKANVLNQNYLFVNGNNFLRASVAVNPQGVGAVSGTLVGPNWYPSAAFIPVSAFAIPSNLYVAAAGTAPEDGFTAGFDGGIARWGDYSTAVADSDGSIWMATEYIGNLPRSLGANWDTLISRANY